MSEQDKEADAYEEWLHSPAFRMGSRAAFAAGRAAEREENLKAVEAIKASNPSAQFNTEYDDLIQQGWDDACDEISTRIRKGEQLSRGDEGGNEQ